MLKSKNHFIFDQNIMVSKRIYATQINKIFLEFNLSNVVAK